MKIFLFVFVLLSILCISKSFGQKDCIKKLSKLSVFFSRNMYVQGSVECDYTGGAIIELVKINDSIKIENLYISCKGYDIASNKFLKKNLNKAFRDSISEDCRIVIPFYFNYLENNVTNEPSEKVKANMSAIIKKYSSSQYAMVDAIICNQGPITGVVKATEAQIIPIKKTYDPNDEVSDTTDDDQ